MPYYVTYGQLQRELEDTYRKSGKRMQFTEAVDALYEKGCLSNTPPLRRTASPMSRDMDKEVFNRMADAVNKKDFLS